MSFFGHAFAAQIRRLPVGKGDRKVTYTVVMLPDDIAAKLPLDIHARLRVDGEIADVPFNGAWQPAGNGAHYLMAPKDVLSQAGVSVGDIVEVRFRVADQDAVDTPAALEAALFLDPDLRGRWEKLTPGQRRGFAYRVRSAKKPATVDKRVAEVVHMVRNGLTYGRGGKAV